jgi:hypothetical protein
MSMSHRFRWLAGGSALLATLAATASPALAAAPPAGIVALRDNGVLTYTAGAGVANEVRMQSTLDPMLYIHDEAAPITLAPSARLRCVQVDAHSVRCSGLWRVQVALGDGNDLFTYEGYSSLATYGGRGDDRLTADSAGGATTFDGGPGRDLCAGPVTKVGCEA